MAQQENGNGSDLCDENIIINEIDGLPNVHPNLEAVGDARRDSSSGEHTDNELEDLPTSLIVTNIHDTVFTSDERKRDMENLFRQFGDEHITFQWLRSFHRLRVNFQTATAAASARLQLHQYRIDESIINCYFAQPVTPVKFTNLRPPAPDKQFLISPPSSPPLGWEPRPEHEPLVNHELLAALATLAPGGSHELHPAAPGQPGIVVHAAGVGAGAGAGAGAGSGVDTAKKFAPQIAHTRCPEHPL